MSQEEFDKRCWANLKVDEQTEEEEEAMKRPVYYAYHTMDPEAMGEILFLFILVLLII